MSFVNANLPPFECLIRNEFLFNQEKGHRDFSKGWVIAIRSIKGFGLQFYVLLESGAIFSGLPLHALTFDKEAPVWDLGIHQLWDSLSYDISVIQIDFIKNMTCEVLLKNKIVEQGYYMFTVDFAHPGEFKGLAETPNEWKALHFIALDNGNIVAYPPNRIIFKDAALTNPEILASKQGYKVNTTPWHCEDGNKWSVGNDDNYYYGQNK